ncbi:MAG TPA: cytosine deaminase, partial [Microbacterium sp.]|nr:cytosine deaminase [Microbacterium sp.]
MSTTAMTPSAVRNVRPWGVGGGDLSDLLLHDGVISGIRPADPAAPAAPNEIDGRGLLALPGLVNAHAHIDKSWWGLPWQSYGGEGGTEGRIRHERARRDEIGMPSVEIT